MTRWIVLIAGLLGMAGVAIGAFAAHGLPKDLAARGLDATEIAKRLEQCEIAVRYHMFHALALLVLGLSPSSRGLRRTAAAAIFILLGIAMFSGGLYSMVFTGVMGHWAIVPSGGLCMLIGWGCVTSLALGNAHRDVL